MSKNTRIEKKRASLKPFKFYPERIQAILDEKLMNVATLAKIIGMTPSGISKILSGHQPRADTIGKIAAALEVKPGHFFD